MSNHYKYTDKFEQDTYDNLTACCFCKWRGVLVGRYPCCDCIRAVGLKFKEPVNEPVKEDVCEWDDPVYSELYGDFEYETGCGMQFWAINKSEQSEMKLCPYCRKQIKLKGQS